MNKVQSAVGAFLTFPSLVAGILANFAVSLSSIVKIHYSHIVMIPIIFVIALAVSVPVLVNLWFQPEYCILTRLEHQWMIRLRSIAGSAIPRKGRSYVATHSKDNEDLEMGEGDLRQVFHETAFLETMRQRHWQSWKFSVVIMYLMTILAQVGIAIVTLTSGYAVITGQGITVGNFTTLVSSIASIVTLGSSVGSFLTNLFESHMMLKQATCVMNDEDISFDGGTDHFKTVESLHLRPMKKSKKQTPDISRGTAKPQQTNPHNTYSSDTVEC